MAYASRAGTGTGQLAGRKGKLFRHLLRRLRWRLLFHQTLLNRIAARCDSFFLLTARFLKLL